MYEGTENITGIGEIIPYINRVTDNVLGIALLIALFTIFFLSLKEYPTEKAFATASFLTSIFAVFFYIMGLITIYFLILFSILTIIGYLAVKE